MRRLVLFATGLVFGAARLSAAEVTPIEAAFEITGKLEDLRHQTSRGTMTFQVAFQQVSYAGKVTRGVLERTADDAATLWLALKDVQLTIDRTSLNGSVGQAACGPMQLHAGHRRELWIAFDLKRLDENGRSRLTVTNTRFQLPADNVAVGRPAWVKTSGLFLNQQNVTEGLRAGIAENRATIESRLVQAAPLLLSRMCQSAADPNSAESKVVAAVNAALLGAPSAPVSQAVPARPRPLETASR